MSAAMLMTGVISANPVIAAADNLAGPPAGRLCLWYRQPAENWMTSALPIGNGLFGAMIFGGVKQEHIQFNDKTLWTGSKSQRGAYQNFGDIYISFAHTGTASKYRRELDLQEGIARVCYTVDSTDFSREYFASYPDKIVVMHFTASRPQAISFDLNLSDAHSGTKTIADDAAEISGKLTVLSYLACVKVIIEGGRLDCSSEQIKVADANAATILLAGGTDYDPISPEYLGSGLRDRIFSCIKDASAKSYAQLKSRHLADYQALFNRVSFSVNDSRSAVPTDELLTSYNAGTYNPALEVLYFQYGRYLMISCSRGMALPSNLQGLWNNSNRPPWECDIHSNINVQMNYWPAEVTNLSECHEPFLDYIYNEAMLQTSWSNMASSLGCRGWTMKTQNNIFGYSDWNWNRPANAWYCMHLWQHYAYTLDSDFLMQKAYPVMKSACEFWLDRLIADADGTLAAPDEWSPEHGPWETGVPYAQQLIWDLFACTIKASEVQNIDADFRTELQKKLSLLDTGVRIGTWGQLREWKYADDDSKDTHRHISHLIGLYPGSQISPLIDPQYSQAAGVSLSARGDGGTGWSRAWKICAWARLLDGNRAHTLLKNALRLTYNTRLDMSDGGGVYENLLDAHPPFQIDGNFGAAAGIAEMLIQSHLGFIHLLPALPDAWPSGQAAGLRTQNAFEVEMEWKDSRLTRAVIKSVKGHPCRLRGYYSVALSDGTSVKTQSKDGFISFDTRSGEKYIIMPLQ